MYGCKSILKGQHVCFIKFPEINLAQPGDTLLFHIDPINSVYGSHGGLVVRHNDKL